MKKQLENRINDLVMCNFVRIEIKTHEKVTEITQYYLEKATYNGVYYETAWCTKEVWDAHPEIHQYWTGSTISETKDVPIYKNFRLIHQQVAQPLTIINKEN